MSEQSGGFAGRYTRRQMSLVFRIIGLSGVAIGVAVAMIGPGLIGDPDLDITLMASGGVIALVGAGIFLWGRNHYGETAL